MEIEKVTIKSYPNGISLFLDEKTKFEDLLLEIGKKFKKGADFFKDATLVLSIEGRELTIEEEQLILQSIEKNSNLSICSIAGKNKKMEQLFENRIHKLKTISSRNQIVIKENKIIKGSLTNLESIESDVTVIILGNVEKGCSVSSEKDIIILGALYGEAIAGIDKKSEHFIFASTMDPEHIAIGDKHFEIAKKAIKKMKKSPHIAHVIDDTIQIEPVTRNMFEEKIC